MQKEKEELDDITMELELADEDDKIPSVLNHRICHTLSFLTRPLHTGTK